MPREKEMSMSLNVFLTKRMGGGKVLFGLPPRCRPSAQEIQRQSDGPVSLALTPSPSLATNQSSQLWLIEQVGGDVASLDDTAEAGAGSRRIHSVSLPLSLSGRGLTWAVYSHHTTVENN